MWLEVTDDSVDVIEDLIDEGHHLSNLYLDKVPSALLGNLDESVTGHVLDTIMGLCHRIEKRRIVIFSQNKIFTRFKCTVRFPPSFLTMHEFKEFVDHCFKELPVGSEKAWILANNIHDV